MSPLLQSANRWWWGRTARERSLLTVMGALLLMVLVWLLVVRPAWALKAAAAERRDEARIDLIRVQSGAARLAATGRKVGTMPIDIEPVVVESAQAAGLTITTGMDQTGGLGFRVETASSGQLFGWLAGLKAAQGLEAARIAVVENADATLSAEGAFARE